MTDDNLFRCIDFISKKTSNDINIVISWFNVETMIDLMRIGCDGKTLTEINTFLRNYDSKYGHQSLKIVNLIVTFYPLLKQYQNEVEKLHNVRVVELNQSNITRIPDDVNEWLSSQTDGKISNVLEKRDVHQETKFIVISALIFKQSWMYEFDEYSTRKESFSDVLDNNHLVDMMNMQENFICHHSVDNRCKIVLLPFMDSKYMSYVLLPDLGVNIDLFASQMTGCKLLQMIEKCELKAVSLKLPKFRLNDTSDFTEVLNEFLPESFRFMNNDFIKITGHQIRMSAAKHAVSLTVNETGVEVAASSVGLCVADGISHHNEFFEFHATRPFLFLIGTPKLNQLIVAAIVKLPLFMHSEHKS